MSIDGPGPDVANSGSQQIQLPEARKISDTARK